MAKPVKVMLMGKAFTLQTDEDEAHVQRVAALVDGRIGEIRQRAAMPETSLALLAAMTIAGDLDKERAQNARLRADLRNRAEALRAHLQAAAGEPGPH